MVPRILLTSIIYFVAAQSLIAQAENKSTINARSLINRDWACTYTVPSKGSKSSKSTISKILSLQPTGRNTATGNAWIIEVVKNSKGRNEYSYKAWRGYYELFEDSKDQRNLVMHLGFVRKYTGKKDSEGILWSFDINFKNKGVSINVPLDDRTVSGKQISISVVRAFFVDSKGMPTIQRYKPSGSLEKLTGLGRVKKVNNTEFLDIKRTVKMDASSPMVILLSSGVYQSPPNACRLHSKYFGRK